MIIHVANPIYDYVFKYLMEDELGRRDCGDVWEIRETL